MVLARTVGLSDSEIARVQAGPEAGWGERDRVLLDAADELHTSWCVSEGTWQALAGFYDEQQLIELPMLVGHYHMVAMTLNSLGVALDDGLTGFSD